MGEKGYLKIIVSCFSISIFLFIYLICQGCGLTTLQKIDTMNNGARSLKASVIPSWDVKCKARAHTCSDQGIKKSDQCAPWKACDLGRDTFYDAINTVHILAASGAVLIKLGKHDEAKQILYKIVEALEHAYKLAKKAGLLK